jgi:hypothetical protein
MPVNVMALDLRMNFGNVEVGHLGPFTAFDDEGRAGQRKLAAQPGEIVFNGLGQIGPSQGKAFVEHRQHFGHAARLGEQSLQQ